MLIERAPALRTGGYLIDFWGLGFEVGDKMGLVPALRRDGYQINEVRLVDARGRKAGGFSARGFQNVMGDRYLSILGSDLSRLIFDSWVTRPARLSATRSQRFSRTRSV